MKFIVKCIFCLSVILFSSQILSAQNACCSKGSKEQIECDKDSNASKVCCTNTGKTKTTSGCTPSNCRGAKTKFGEAKVISNLRFELINLKEKMETHKTLKFSDKAISVHDIIGDTDEASLTIVAEHVKLINTEIASTLKINMPEITLSENNAIKVKQLNERIKALNEAL